MRKDDYGHRLSDWNWREKIGQDVICAATVKRWRGTVVDGPEIDPNDEVPLLAHWTAFLPTEPTSAMGRDGHPKRGGFLPPVPLERRMWAGVPRQERLKGKSRARRPMRLT